MGAAFEGRILTTIMNQEFGTDESIRFAEKIIEILDEGRFSSTYKLAVLLALMDLCFEKNVASGMAPDSVTTRQLAEKIIEIYWPHTIDYPRTSGTLRQNSGKQAEIPAAILSFRRDIARDPSIQLHRAKTGFADGYERLVRSVEWTLIEMPLPKLQTVGPSRTPFLYEISWDESVRRGDLRREFDNNIRLKPGAGDRLIQLNGLLRPFIQ